MNTQDPKLAQLAKRIRTEHEAAEGFTKKSVERAVKCGDLLLEARKLVLHGNYKEKDAGWTKYVEETCGIKYRTAQRYSNTSGQND